VATVQGTLDQSLEDAVVTARQTAAMQGYALLEGQSTPKLLVFKKGASAFSWGSQLTVAFHVVSETETGMTITADETWAIFDWGRGTRAARKLLDTLGAKRAY
jgi:hypothetical protein